MREVIARASHGQAGTAEMTGNAESSGTWEATDLVIKTMTMFLATQTQNICSPDLGNGSTNFLPMKSFTGESEQNDEDSFEQWMDHNEEHARMAP